MHKKYCADSAAQKSRYPATKSTNTKAILTLNPLTAGVNGVPTVVTGTMLFFTIRRIPTALSAAPAFVAFIVGILETGPGASIAEDLPLTFSDVNSASAPLDIARALRTSLYGDPERGVFARIGLAPGADYDKEFFFATDDPKLTFRVSEAMKSLPGTRRSTWDVKSTSKHRAQSDFLWEGFTNELLEDRFGMKDSPWRDRVRKTALVPSRPQDGVSIRCS